MRGSDVYLECSDCKKKIGIAFVASVGTTHQWITGCRCVECAKKYIAENRLELEKSIGKEKLQEVITWLEG